MKSYCIFAVIRLFEVELQIIGIMKHAILLTLAILASLNDVSAQTKFRVDYDVITLFTNAQWSDWEDALNTFVFNANENGDIIHYTARGEKKLYRKISTIDEGQTDNGDHFQILTVLDENGNEFYLQYFDNP